MYAYIKGQLEEINDVDHIVVENNGIGYSLRVSSRMMEELPAVGQQVKVYTYQYVREDAMELYGFLTREDKKIFELLIGVSGIGPKGALAILSVMSTDDLRFAVLSEDAKAIAKAPGVGNKTAQRLIIELKDKLSLEDAFEEKLAHTLQEEGKREQLGKKQEAIEALVALGYSASEASGAIRRLELPEDESVEEILKQALKQMAFL